MPSALIDLVLPRECAGCGRPDSSWCTVCRDALAEPPEAVRPRVSIGSPCWALGPYGGPGRGAIVAAKERGRRDLAVPLGAALAGAIDWLRSEGEIDPPELSPLILVPAPSRRRAARRRGGDPVTRFCRAAAVVLRPEPVRVAPVLRLDAAARDSVGLSAAQRADNLRGRIRVDGRARSDRDGWPGRAGWSGRDGWPGGCAKWCDQGQVILVDDVVTTGTTAAESVAALNRFGVTVAAVLVIAAVR
ncbi:MAG: ComF family protein [Rhodococcus sp. (in: high G+C Gram-positive bacteria)]